MKKIRSSVVRVGSESIKIRSYMSRSSKIQEEQHQVKHKELEFDTEFDVESDTDVI
jgi:hypothetical protein